MERYAHYSDSNRITLPLIDVAIIFVAFRVAGFLLLDTWQFANQASFFVAFALLWWILSREYANIFRLDRLISYSEKLGYVLRTFLVHGLLLFGVGLLLRMQWLPLPHLATVYGFAIVGVVLGRFVLAFCYRLYTRHFAQPHSRFIIVGASESGQKLYYFLRAHDSDGTQFKGFFADGDVPPALRHLVQGSVAEVQEYCRRTPIDEIYFALPLTQQSLIEELTAFAAENFLSLRIVPDYHGTLGQDVKMYYCDHLPVLTVRREPLSMWTNLVLKRTFDIGFSLLIICGVFPVLLPLLALAIKIDSPGPVFFKQLRPGRRNQLFPCYKLRTMVHNHGRPEEQATRADPRVTKVGRYLRKYNLDELPQFFNVLLGHMSVVGPRPNLVSQLEEYSKHIRTYRLRHAVLPGITGYAQVHGWRGETRAPNAMEKRVEYDLKYLENWSFGLDLRIIGKTVRNIVHGEENAY
ncbi:exopolysaccharide biosynthesis polyprenyl glycosylphosphotransferase [Hymenobacter sp. BT683]|uniref:Exopolysaccharide biosynthesis polyprenyl glycosylphosphotransferase n=1 Tax=Hymenobacter jeongseonensis TaxID=2791027 RepID=A0ABS0ID15_9BACT|nr:exopolysaccharide biosynthesis polyprenyl glycosylphosphotransferase [Hymenobacter jeongseonensis]MBF9236244.1 exopolysaccharide biosynthesis polyprenyl glycosylphosphotransferase [Hymenobacter jeongseonensis]